MGVQISQLMVHDHSEESQGGNTLNPINLNLGSPGSQIFLGVGGTLERIISFPDSSGTIALIDRDQTWTSLQTFNDTTLKLTDQTDTSKTLVFQLGSSTANADLILDYRSAVDRSLIWNLSGGTGGDLTLTWAGTASRTVTIPSSINFTVGGLEVASQVWTKQNTFQTAGASGTAQLRIKDSDGGFYNELVAAPSANRTNSLPDGDGAITIQQGVNAPGLTGSVGTTAILTTPQPGIYAINYYLECTTAGTAGTVTLSILFTDGVGAQTFTSASLSLSVTGRLPFPTPFSTRVASGNLSYSTTVTGGLGAFQYAVLIGVVQIPL